MQTDVVVQRIIAFIIDSIVWLILTLVLVGVLSAAGVDMFDAERNSDDSGFYWRASLTNSWTWVWSALFLLYKGGQEALYGQTIGKRLLKIRVVKAHTLATINWQDAFLRNLIFLAPFILLNTEYGILELIGFIWLVAGTISMIRSSERQRLGDRAANTVVVRNVPAAQPLLWTSSDRLRRLCRPHWTPNHGSYAPTAEVSFKGSRH